MLLYEHAERLQGKTYISGWSDCFTLVRELFQNFANIEIKDYSRPFGWHLTNKFNFFDTLHQKEGFTPLNISPLNIQLGDVLVIQLGRSVTNNHVAVYIGRNKILHHLEGGLSAIEEYTPKWQHRVQYVLRHPKMVEALSIEYKPILSNNKLLGK